MDEHTALRPIGNAGELSLAGLRGLFVPFVGSLLVLFALAVLGAALLRAPCEAASAWLVQSLGLTGLYWSTVVLDSIPTPLSYAHVLWLLLQGGEQPALVFLVASAGSVTGGAIGFTLGRWFGLPMRIDAWLARRHPRLLPLVERYGGWGLATVGLLPVPFALGTWSAGAMGVPTHHAAVALLVRIPKTLLYVLFILGGQRLAEGLL